jgi:hypothetical protein
VAAVSAAKHCSLRAREGFRSLDVIPVLCRTRLFGGGAEEDAAHLALGEIEDDAAVDRQRHREREIEKLANSPDLVSRIGKFARSLIGSKPTNRVVN